MATRSLFSIATTLRCRVVCYTFLCVAPLTHDVYLIMLGVKQRGIKYLRMILWYNLTTEPWANTLSTLPLGRNIYIYIYIYVCVCVCVCIHMHIYICNMYIYKNMYIYIDVYTYIYINVYIYIYIYICIYVHTYIYICIYKLNPVYIYINYIWFINAWFIDYIFKWDRDHSFIQNEEVSRISSA